MELSMTKGIIVLMPPPEGYDVNFDHPKRNGDITCYCLTAVGGFLALLFLGQRLYVKAFLRKPLTIDDYLLILAWLFSFAIQAPIVRAFVRKYIGVHVWEMPFAKFQENYLFGVVGASTGIFFASIFACDPIAMGWDLTVTNGKCIHRPALYEATASFGVIIDCLIIAIPIPMVLGLQMSRSKKIGLILMFALGSIIVVTSIVRLALLVTEIEQIDSACVAGPINYWVLIEANLLLICASLPTVRQFLRTVAPGLLCNIQNSKYSKGSRDIVTIGSGSRNKNSRKKGPYDSDIMMETLVDGSSSSHANDIEGISRSSVDGENKGAIPHGGIMKTQTAQVTYTIDRAEAIEADRGRSFV